MNKKFARFCGLGVSAVALVLATGCGETPSTGSAPPAPSCSVTNIANVAHHRITISAESNIAAGTNVDLVLFGNGVQVDSYATDAGFVGAIVYTLDLPQYGYTVGWKLQVVYGGRVLCWGGYTDVAGAIDPEWAALPNDPGWWYGN